MENKKGKNSNSSALFSNERKILTVFAVRRAVRCPYCIRHCNSLYMCLCIVRMHVGVSCMTDSARVTQVHYRSTKLWGISEIIRQHVSRCTLTRLHTRSTLVKLVHALPQIIQCCFVDFGGAAGTADATNSNNRALDVNHYEDRH